MTILRPITALSALPPEVAGLAALIEAPAQPGDRQTYSDWLAPVAGLSLQFHMNHVAPSDLPMTLTRVECHPHAAQVFLPLDVDRYLVTLLPGTSAPDPAGAMAVILPGTVGIAYRPGTWHAGIVALGRPGQFAVQMWRGAVDDDRFADIAPLTIAAPQALTGTGP